MSQDNIRILIVEDEGIVAMGIQDKLENLGYHVLDIVSTGQNAIDTAISLNPNLVLMDINLIGDMDGIEAAQHIRDKVNMPVVFLTAFGNQTILNRAKQVGPSGYVLKPFLQRELQIAIEMALYRHTAEEAIRDSELRYRTLMDTAHDAILILDADSGQVIKCNAMATELFNMHKDDIIDSHISKVHKHSSSVDYVELLKSNPDELLDYCGIDCSIMTDDNLSETWVEPAFSYFKVAQKGYIQCVYHNITRRKHAEDAIEKRQDAFKTVYEQATTLDSSMGNICREVATKLASQLDAPIVLVEQFADGILKTLAVYNQGRMETMQDYEPHDIYYEQISEKAEVCTMSGDLSAQFPDNPVMTKYNPHSMLCVPVMISEGQVVGSVTVLDSRKREFDRDDIYLCEIFAGYIANVMEKHSIMKKLESAQKLEVIGKLAAGVAHEVRNPLNAIMAITDALATDIGDDPENSQFIEHMRSQVLRLSNLMRDLLDLGKPVEHLSFDNMRLGELCRSALDVAASSDSCKDRNISINEGRAGHLTVYVDSKRMQQIIGNLLENASHHSDKKQPIRVELYKQAGNMALIKIIDRGSGVPNNIMQKVFEPFFTTRRAGTGLGLSIVKHFVEVHGGRIYILNNTPEPGATVEIVLPVVSSTEKVQ